MKPKLKLRIKTNYLASIFSGVGTKVRKDGLAAYVDLDYSQFAPITTYNPSEESLVLQNVDGSFAKITLSDYNVFNLSIDQTWTGVQSYTDGKFRLLGSTSGATTVKAPATGGGTATFFAGSDTIVGKSTADTFTNKTLDTAATGNNLLINGVAVTANTGTGAVVRANSPSLITPALGTPSSVTLTAATGLPIATGVSGLGTGTAAALGIAVGSTGSVLVNGGALGAPSSGNLTSATGLPIATGVSGLGAGTAAALAIAPGTTGSFIVRGSTLGTPSGGSLTNLTGLPIDTGTINNLPVTRLNSGIAASATTFWRGDGTWATPPGGAGGIDDKTRQNILIDRIYESKLLGYARRGVNETATGFKGSTDALNFINTASSSNYTVVNSGDGYVQPSVSVTTQTIVAPGSAGPDGAGNTFYDLNVPLTTGDVIYGLGVASTAAQAITLKIGIRTSVGNITNVVSQPVSHPGGGVVFFPLSSNYTVPAGGNVFVGAYCPTAFATTVGSILVAYRAGDATGAGTYTELTSAGAAMSVQKNPVVASSMTLVSAAKTTDANVSFGRVLVEFDNSASPALNTDLTAEVSNDGGTNWATASLSSVTANGQSGRKIAETVDQSTVSGSSFVFRIKTLNSKLVPIYGATLSVR